MLVEEELGQPAHADATNPNKMEPGPRHVGPTDDLNHIVTVGRLDFD